MKLDLDTRLAMLETELMLPAFAPAATNDTSADEALRRLLRVIGRGALRDLAPPAPPGARRRAAAADGGAREPVYG
jgi:hypothetical protein